MVTSFRVSYSSLGVAQSCSRKFELQKMYQHPERGFESIAMSAGQALHEGYQNYLIHRDLDRALWTLGLSYPHTNCWDEFDDRSWEACMSTLIAMIEHGNDSEWDVAYIANSKKETVPAIEVPFEIELRGLNLPDGRPISYVGWIDAIMERYNGQEYRTLDIKTHRDRRADRTAKFLYDSQQVPYGIAIEHALGRKIDGFSVNYLDCFLDILEPRIVPHEYNKTHEDISEWLLGTVMQVERIIKQAEMDLFLRADHGCMFYNKPCKFLDVCQSRDREIIQKVLLVDGPAAPEQEWNPWIKCYIDIEQLKEEKR